MDNMLPSPSFNIPSIGTPHHVMEEVCTYLTNGHTYLKRSKIDYLDVSITILNSRPKKIISG